MSGEYGAEQKAAWRESQLKGLSEKTLAFIKKNDYLVDALIHGKIVGTPGGDNTLIGLFEQMFEAYTKELGGKDEMFSVMNELAEKREANEEQGLEDMFDEPDYRQTVIECKKAIVGLLSTESKKMIMEHPVIRLRFFETDQELLENTIRFLNSQGLVEIEGEIDEIISELIDKTPDLDQLYE